MTGGKIKKNKKNQNPRGSNKIQKNPWTKNQPPHAEFPSLSRKD